MTIEEKAKAYDEVCKKIAIRFGSNVANEIFSQFEESEDERINEWLINLVKSHIEWLEDRIREQLSNGQVYGDELVKAKNSLTWLEKQGEQKPAELSNSCEFSIKTWINIVAYVLKEHNGIGNYLDDPEVKDTAEKLQKRYKFDSASEEWDRVYRKGLDAGVNKGKAIALREKNHAWSKEDERHFSWLIEHLGQSAGLYDNLIDWLKSLKDRVQPQPKQEWKQENTGDLNDFENAMMHIANSFFGQYAGLDPNDTNAIKEQANLLLELVPNKEWSEEDSRILYNVKAYIGYAAGQRGVKDELFKEANEWLNSLPIGFIHNKNYNEDMVTLLVGELKQIANDNNAPEQYQEEIDWLKSLRPQNTWKPSNEQMGALANACDGKILNLDYLNSLYQDLKKLREE